MLRSRVSMERRSNVKSEVSVLSGHWKKVGRELMERLCQRLGYGSCDGVGLRQVGSIHSLVQNKT